MDGQNELNGSL